MAGMGDQLFGMHGNALALRSQRLALLASNIHALAVVVQHDRHCSC